MMLTCAEPFAGAGGLAIGLVRAGFKCVYATDKDRDAVGTLAQSVDAADCIMHSPDTIAPFARAVGARTGRLDLLAGGVPCQPFSQGGWQFGKLDPRDCFPHFTAMAKAIQPRVIMIENVAALCNAKHSHYLGAVLAEMREQYTIDYRVLCAADYGAPQMRRRIIIVGFRDPTAAARFRWPIVTHGEPELGAAKWKTRTYWDEHRLPVPALEAAFGTSQLHDAFKKAQGKVDVTGKVLIGNGTTGAGLSFLANADRPSPTISVRRPYAARFLGDPKVVVKSTPGELVDPRPGVRRWRTLRDVLTLEEMTRIRGQWVPVDVLAKLQDFPADLRWVGKTPAVVRQIGNAVPPRLSEVVGLSIAAALVEPTHAVPA